MAFKVFACIHPEALSPHAFQADKEVFAIRNRPRLIPLESHPCHDGIALRLRHEGKHCLAWSAGVQRVPRPPLHVELDQCPPDHALQHDAFVPADHAKVGRLTGLLTQPAQRRHGGFSQGHVIAHRLAE